MYILTRIALWINWFTLLGCSVSLVLAGFKQLYFRITC